MFKRTLHMTLKNLVGYTRSHLRFGPKPIRSTYLIKQADFLSCSMDVYLQKFDLIKEIKHG